MVLLRLLACGCPTFDEMEVRGDADETFLADVEAALADFAAWTGRDGVCVPAIEVRDHLRKDDWVGVYRGRHLAILLDRDAPAPYRSTLHELCHALDRIEDHADPDVFPLVEAEEDYESEADRAGEGFAQACEDGALDLGLLRDVEDACGFVATSPADRHLADHVFTAFPQASLDEGAAPYAFAEGELTLPAAYTVYDGAVVGGRGWLVVDWFVEAEDRYAIGLVEVLGDRVGDPVRLLAESPVGGTIARAQDRLVVFVWDWAEGALAFDVGADVAPLALEGLPERVYEAALVGDVLYARYADDGVAGFGAWSLASGQAVDVASPEEALLSLRPGPDGLEGEGITGRWRLGPDGWVRVTTVPAYVYGGSPLPGGERLDWVYGVPVVEDDGWRLPVGGCGLTMEARALLEGDQGVRVLGGEWSEDGAAIPLWRLASRGGI